MELRRIRTDEEHTAALAEIERLWGSPVGSADGDRLDALITSVDEYESKRWPIEAGDPIDFLHFAIAEMGRSRADLVRIVGSASRVAQILNRESPLTDEMIQEISEAWHIPKQLLTQRSEVRGSHRGKDRAGGLEEAAAAQAPFGKSRS